MARCLFGNGQFLAKTIERVVYVIHCLWLLFGMREVVMTLFMQKFKEGVVHFPGLYDLLVNLDLKNSSTVEDLMSDEMHAFGRALLENPDRFSLWMEELFRLANGLDETEVYHRCDAVYKVWQYLQKHSITQVWLPYQAPAANNQFRYLNRKTTVRHIPKV
jgi:hypothetical protein